MTGVDEEQRLAPSINMACWMTVHITELRPHAMRHMPRMRRMYQTGWVPAHFPFEESWALVFVAMSGARVAGQAGDNRAS
jgi:hypothetical protein